MLVVRELRPKSERRFTDAEKSAAWRARHPERAKVVRQRAYEKRKAAVEAIKAERGCGRCGFNDPRALDFHHRDGGQKELAVSALLRCASMDRVLAEVAKCDVLCANCHRVVHAGDITAQIAVFFRAS